MIVFHGVITVEKTNTKGTHVKSFADGLQFRPREWVFELFKYTDTAKKKRRTALFFVIVVILLWCQ